MPKYARKTAGGRFSVSWLLHKSDQGNRISMKPIEKKSLYLKISDSIYRYIQMNNLQPGDKLPSERDMSSMLQTSRNSVREALRILEDRGLIYVKTGSGVFINNPYGENNSLTIQLTNCTLTEMVRLASDNLYSHVLDRSFHDSLYKIGRNNAIEQMINKIRSYRFIQQEDSQNGNDFIWLATIPQHLALAQALKDCKLAAAIQAIDEINEYGFKIARK